MHVHRQAVAVGIGIHVGQPRILRVGTQPACQCGAAGAIGFKVGKDVERISAEIGYWLAEPYWGRGVVTEVLITITKYAIDTFALKRVFAVPFEWNDASFRVLEKAGYIMEGRLLNSSIKDGKIISQRMYAYTTK